MHSLSGETNLCYIEIMRKRRKIHRRSRLPSLFFRWGMNSDRPVIQLQCNLSYLIYCQIIFEWMLNNNIMTMKWISHYLIFKINICLFIYWKYFFFLLLYHSVTHNAKPHWNILSSSHILKSLFIHLF